MKHKKTIIIGMLCLLLVRTHNGEGGCIVFTGVGIISTGWREKSCLTGTFQTTISIANITTIDMSQSVEPKNISWEYYDFSEVYHSQVNTSSIVISRDPYTEGTNFSYCLTVWIDEIFGTVIVNICRSDLVNFHSVPISGSIISNPETSPVSIPLTSFIALMVAVTIILLIKQKIRK